MNNQETRQPSKERKIVAPVLLTTLAITLLCIAGYASDSNQEIKFTPSMAPTPDNTTIINTPSSSADLSLKVTPDPDGEEKANPMAAAFYVDGKRHQ